MVKQGCSAKHGIKLALTHNGKRRACAGQLYHPLQHGLVGAATHHQRHALQRRVLGQPCQQTLPAEINCIKIIACT